MRSLLIVLTLLPTLSCAEIYRWTDAEGRVHFGERPPAQAERIEVRPQVVERDQSTREREARSERFFEARREEAAQQQQRDAEQSAVHEQQCAALRARMAGLSGAGTYFSADESGERRYYSDAEVEAARREVRTQVEQHCD